MSVSPIAVPNLPQPTSPIDGRPLQPWIEVPRDWRRPSVRDSWRIWWNDAAEYGEIHPRPSIKEVTSFYDIDTYYTRDDDRNEELDDTFTDRLRVSLAYRLDKGVTPDTAFWRRTIPHGASTALEIGSGNGDRLVEIREIVSDVWGVEPDPSALSTSREKGLEVHPGFAETLPPEITCRNYDFILFTHVLEHCLDPLKALRNAAELLSDRGVLMVETPNNAALGLSQQKRNWYWLDAPRHLNFFTEASLNSFATMSGLQVTDVQYWGYCRQFLNSWLFQQALIASRMAYEDDDLARHISKQRRSAWGLLAATAFAPSKRKYDSVRLICRRAPT